MATSGNRNGESRAVKNEPISKGDAHSSPNTNSMPTHGTAPMPEPTNAWKANLSGEEPDLDIGCVPGHASEWGTGSRGQSEKRLLSSSGRKVLGRAHRKNRVGLCDYPINLGTLSSGEEGEKPTRPSDIVGAESDSCSDFAYTPKMRIRHRRRKRATAMRIRNIDKTGTMISMPRWLLPRRGMAKYSLDLRPPQEDIYVPRISEYREFLSRNSRRGPKYKRFPGDRLRKCSSEVETSASVDESVSSASAGCSDDQDFFELSDVPGLPPRSLAYSNLVMDGDNAAQSFKHQRQHFSRPNSANVAVDLTQDDNGIQSNLANGDVSKPIELPKSVEEDGEQANVVNGPMTNPISGEQASLSNEHMTKGIDASNGEDQEQANLYNGEKKEINANCFGYTLASPSVIGTTRAERSAGRGIFSAGKRLRVLSHLPPPRKKRKKEDSTKSLLDEMNYQVFNDPASLFGPKVEHLRDPVAAAKFKPHGESSLAEKELAKDMEDTGDGKEGEAPENAGESCSSSESEEYEKTVTVFERMKADALCTFYYSKKGRMDGWSDVDDDERGTVRGESRETSAADVNPEFEKHTRQIGSRILAKMGFTGRLGARGTGIVQALEVTEPLDRAGLGSKLTDARRLDTEEQQDPRAIATRSGSSSSIRTTKPQENGTKQITKNIKRKKRLHAKTKDEDVIASVDANQSDAFRDNGRRGVIVDFDALLLNSHARRLNAFTAFVAGCPEFSSVSNIGAMLRTRIGDLCDREFIRKLLDECELAVNEDNISKYMDKLDIAFEEAPAPDVDERLILKLKKTSEELMLGVIHYGSERRMNRELKIAGLQHSLSSDDFFLSEEREIARVAVGGTDEAPYLQSWRDIFCQLGVHPCQSVMVLNDHGRSRVLSGVVAASMLGARSFVRVDSDVGPGYRVVSDLKLGRNNMFGATVAAADRVFAPHIDFVKFTRKVQSVQVCRVWARYSADALWYAGREHFRPTLSASDDEGDDSQLRVLVQFDGYNNTEWVDVNDVHPLSNENYLKLKENSFPGLLDPDIDTAL